MVSPELCSPELCTPRDSAVTARFPEWVVFAPGVAPMLAVAATYAGVVVLGHSVMRLIAGPAAADPLARCPQEAASPAM